MAKGKKPLAPRNPLATAIAKMGKRPVLPYHQALQARRDASRLRKLGAAKIGPLPTMDAPARILLPINPRHHADHLQIGRNGRAVARAEEMIEDAQRRIADEIRRAEAAGEADAAAAGVGGQPGQEPTHRPPQARYAALKDGRPG